MAGNPVVEPEPWPQQSQQRFEEWVDYFASMTTLILRFRTRIAPEKLTIWIDNLQEHIQDTESRLTEQRSQAGEEEIRGAETLLAFLRGLTKLAQGTEPAEVQTSVPRPFDQIIAQISRSARVPVWQQPGNAPLDFMVEQVAQKAVKALRRHDQKRASRLALLAFRYELMTIDLRKHAQLMSIVNFLDVLSTFLYNDGQPTDSTKNASTLEEPYRAILAAIYQEGQREIPEEEA
jgi:hypothetical protein